MSADIFVVGDEKVADEAGEVLIHAGIMPIYIHDLTEEEQQKLRKFTLGLIADRSKAPEEETEVDRTLPSYTLVLPSDCTGIHDYRVEALEDYFKRPFRVVRIGLDAEEIEVPRRVAVSYAADKRFIQYPNERVGYNQFALAIKSGKTIFCFKYGEEEIWIALKGDRVVTGIGNQSKGFRYSTFDKREFLQFLRIFKGHVPIWVQGFIDGEKNPSKIRHAELTRMLFST